MSLPHIHDDRLKPCARHSDHQIREGRRSFPAWNAWILVRWQVCHLLGEKPGVFLVHSFLNVAGARNCRWVLVVWSESWQMIWTKMPWPGPCDESWWLRGFIFSLLIEDLDLSTDLKVEKSSGIAVLFTVFLFGRDYRCDKLDRNSFQCGWSSGLFFLSTA